MVFRSIQLTLTVRQVGSRVTSHLLFPTPIDPASWFLTTNPTPTISQKYHSYHLDASRYKPWAPLSLSLRPSCQLAGVIYFILSLALSHALSKFGHIVRKPV